eukprot:scaffold1666_cov424-Prasinococcus_capsulatus_cf.AAC.5
MSGAPSPSATSSRALAHPRAPAARDALRLRLLYLYLASHRLPAHSTPCTRQPPVLSRPSHQPYRTCANAPLLGRTAFAMLGRLLLCSCALLGWAPLTPPLAAQAVRTPSFMSYPLHARYHTWTDGASGRPNAALTSPWVPLQLPDCVDHAGRLRDRPSGASPSCGIHGHGIGLRGWREVQLRHHGRQQGLPQAHTRNPDHTGKQQQGLRLALRYALSGPKPAQHYTDTQTVNFEDTSTRGGCTINAKSSSNTFYAYLDVRPASPGVACVVTCRY